MVNSEEIAAALEVVLDACRRLVDEWPNEGDEIAIPILRAHLSRLREEAEFRDAAMEYCRVWSNVHDPLGTRIAVSDKLLASFRALEEPRNA